MVEKCFIEKVELNIVFTTTESEPTVAKYKSELWSMLHRIEIIKPIGLWKCIVVEQGAYDIIMYAQCTFTGLCTRTRIILGYLYKITMRYYLKHFIPARFAFAYILLIFGFHFLCVMFFSSSCSDKQYERNQHLTFLDEFIPSTKERTTKKKWI